MDINAGGIAIGLRCRLAWRIPAGNLDIASSLAISWTKAP
jgi:hypothetical protein